MSIEAMPVEAASHRVPILEVRNGEIVLIRPRVTNTFATFDARNDNRQLARKAVRSHGVPFALFGRYLTIFELAVPVENHALLPGTSQTLLGHDRGDSSSLGADQPPSRR
jgi:hypothetical protein